jgi:hypothetical protein
MSQQRRRFPRPSTWPPPPPGLAIRPTDERLAHVLEHPEMVGMESAIEQTIVHPNQVVESISDPVARLYYRFYMGTMVGDKYLCVVVKIIGEEAFVLTADGAVTLIERLSPARVPVANVTRASTKSPPFRPLTSTAGSRFGGIGQPRQPAMFGPGHKGRARNASVNGQVAAASLYRFCNSDCWKSPFAHECRE